MIISRVHSIPGDGAAAQLAYRGITMGMASLSTRKSAVNWAEQMTYGQRVLESEARLGTDDKLTSLLVPVVFRIPRR